MADQKASTKKEGKQKKPSALKRAQQSEKKRLSNRSYRAKVLTAIRTFEQSLSNKEAEDSVRTKLNAIFSLMDRGVKKGIYKSQAASRKKSRLAARI